eukprot:11758994-Prorocentrum_lima.AAC.1
MGEAGEGRRASGGEDATTWGTDMFANTINVCTYEPVVSTTVGGGVGATDGATEVGVAGLDAT